MVGRQTLSRADRSSTLPQGRLCAHHSHRFPNITCMPPPSSGDVIPKYWWSLQESSGLIWISAWDVFQFPGLKGKSTPETAYWHSSYSQCWQPSQWVSQVAWCCKRGWAEQGSPAPLSALATYTSSLVAAQSPSSCVVYGRTLVRSVESVMPLITPCSGCSKSMCIGRALLVVAQLAWLFVYFFPSASTFSCVDSSCLH